MEVVVVQSIQRLGYGLEISAFDSRLGENSLSPKMSRATLGPNQPPLYWVPHFFFGGIKRPQLDIDYLSPPSREAEIDSSYNATPFFTFMLRSVPLWFVCFYKHEAVLLRSWELLTYSKKNFNFCSTRFFNAELERVCPISLYLYFMWGKGGANAHYFQHNEFFPVNIRTWYAYLYVGLYVCMCLCTITGYLKLPVNP